MMEEVKILFDKTGQRLYMQNADGEITEIWVMGMGIPAQLMFGDPREADKEL